MSVVNVVATNNGPTWSRQSILRWCNETLKCDIPKVDFMCTGAAYCCLMDMLFPDCINLRRVKFVAFREPDFEHNLVMLQQCFKKLYVIKRIPIDKLVKAKFQDNYEFAVWFRMFFDANYKGLPIGYDVVDRRHGEPIKLGQLQPTKTKATTVNKCATARRVNTKPAIQSNQELLVSTPDLVPNTLKKKVDPHVAKTLQEIETFGMKRFRNYCR